MALGTKDSAFPTVTSWTTGSLIAILERQGDGSFLNKNTPIDQLRAGLVAVFSTLGGNPYDNTALANALNALQTQITALQGAQPIKKKQVASQTEMVNWTQANPGDEAIRSDEGNKTYILSGGTYNQVEAWIPIELPDFSIDDFVDSTGRANGYVVKWDAVNNKAVWGPDTGGSTVTFADETTYAAAAANEAVDPQLIKPKLDAKLDKNTPITPATKPKISYDADGLVTGGADLTASDIPTLPQSKITDLTTDLSDKYSKTTNKGTLTDYDAGSAGKLLEADLLLSLIGDRTLLLDLGEDLYEKLQEVFNRVGNYALRTNGLMADLDNQHRSFFQAATITANATVTVSNKPVVSALALESNYVFGYFLITKNTAADCTLTVSGGTLVGGNTLSGASGSKFLIEYRGICKTAITDDVFAILGGGYAPVTPGPATTDALTEGTTNLYFTNTRARAAIVPSSEFTYSGGNLGINQIAANKITGLNTVATTGQADVNTFVPADQDNTVGFWSGLIASTKVGVKAAFDRIQSAVEQLAQDLADNVATLTTALAGKANDNEVVKSINNIDPAADGNVALDASDIFLTSTGPLNQVIVNGDSLDLLAQKTQGQINDIIANAVDSSQFKNRFGIVKELVNNGRYNAFGRAIRVSQDKIFYCYRSGSDHLLGGRIDLVEYTISTGAVAAPRTVLNPTASRELRDVNGGVIGNNIFLFYTERDPVSGLTTDLGYIKSSDLTGTSWTKTSLPLPSLDGGISYGKLVQGNAAGEYFQPYYEQKTDNTAFKIFIRKTANYGSSWTLIPVYSGALRYTESALVNIGSNKYILITRINGGGKPVIFVSSDNCQTWTFLGVSNLGSSTVESMADAILDNGKLIVTIQDRQDGFIKVYAADPDLVFASATAFPAPAYYYYNNNIAGGYINKLGYPDVAVIAKGTYFITWAYEFSSSQAAIEYSLDSLQEIYKRELANLTHSCQAIVSRQLVLAHTGTTAETEKFNLGIPISAFKVGSRLSFSVVFTCTNNANAKTLKWKVNGTTIASNTFPSVAGNSFGATAYVTANNELYFQGANVPLALLGSVTPTSDLIFTLTLQHASASDTITLKYIEILVFK